MDEADKLIGTVTRTLSFSATGKDELELNTDVAHLQMEKADSNSSSGLCAAFKRIIHLTSGRSGEEVS